MTEPRDFPPAGGPLHGVNESFHRAYADMRRFAEHDAPVLIVIGDALVVFRLGVRSELSFVPRLYHVLKSIAHSAISAYTLVMSLDGPRDGSSAKHLKSLHELLTASMAVLPEEVEDHDMCEGAKAVLLPSLSLVERTLADGAVSTADLAAFAHELGTPLLQLTDHATRTLLTALHAAVEDAIRPFDANERRGLQVVVVGDHQARMRSAAMQYFQHRLREPEGVDERVTFGEGVDDEQGALSLVGTRRLDRAIAAAFFGDPRRLQRDVLGDSAAAQLTRMALTPIV